MKISVVHKDGSISYVGSISFKDGHLPIVTLVDDLSEAVNMLWNVEYFNKTESSVIKEVYDGILTKENVKSVHIYDKQFIRSMKIQKIKNLI